MVLHPSPDHIRASIATELCESIARWLEHERRGVRESALKSINAIIVHGQITPTNFHALAGTQSADIRLAILTTAVIDHIVQLVGDPDAYVQRAALGVVLSLAKYGEKSLRIFCPWTQISTEEDIADTVGAQVSRHIPALLDSIDPSATRSTLNSMAAMIINGETNLLEVLPSPYQVRRHPRDDRHDGHNRRS